MKLKKVLAGALTLVLSLGLVACGDKAESDTIEEGKLIVAMECAYAPFNWTQLDDSHDAVDISNESSYAGGYDVQMAKRVAEDLGLELSILKMDWDALPNAVNAGTADLIMAGMSPTAERQKSVDFSEPYYESQLVVVVRKDGPYADATSLADLEGANITAQLNTFHYTVIDQIPGVNKVEPTEDFGMMRTALQSGLIDGYISERPEALSASEAIDSFTYVEFPEGEGFEASKEDIAVAAGMKKGNEKLLEKVNAALAKITDEDRQKIMDDAIKHQPINQ